MAHKLEEAGTTNKHDCSNLQTKRENLLRSEVKSFGSSFHSTERVKMFILPGQSCFLHRCEDVHQRAEAWWFSWEYATSSFLLQSGDILSFILFYFNYLWLFAHLNRSVFQLQVLFFVGEAHCFWLLLGFLSGICGFLLCKKWGNGLNCNSKLCKTSILICKIT